MLQSEKLTFRGKVGEYVRHKPELVCLSEVMISIQLEVVELVDRNGLDGIHLLLSFYTSCNASPLRSLSCTCYP
jgi:hypothetical protein